MDPEAAGKQRHLGLLFGAHKTVIKGMGTDFAGIREYQPSDGLRFIDWKSTARSRNIMTREFETEKNIRVILFLDSSGSMGAGLLENSKLEYVIRSAVILSKLALERRDLVGLVSFNDAVRNYVAAKMGKKHFYRILDTLALVQASGGVQMHDAVEYIIKRATRASFYIFLTDLEGDSADIIDAIKYARAFKNRILVISPFGPWFESQTALSPVDKALAEAISENLYGKRKQIVDKIRRMGVDVIDVGPDDILPTVISYYLKAKRRGAGIT